MVFFIMPFNLQVRFHLSTFPHAAWGITCRFPAVSYTRTQQLCELTWFHLAAVSSLLHFCLIFSSQADYFSCVATLLYTKKDNCLYQACPSSDCNKKVIDQHNGWFRCEKCNRDFPNFKYRLLLSVSPQRLMLGCHACIAVSNTFTCVDVITHALMINPLFAPLHRLCLSVPGQLGWLRG